VPQASEAGLQSGFCQDAVYRVEQPLGATDQGASDNLGLCGVANVATGLDESTDTFRRIALKARRILVLSVDGDRPRPGFGGSGTRSTPTISRP
jgi:hypothetical protein